MNLTSKRMLRFLSVCAGAFALTASAQTTWVSDNFEADTVAGGYTNAAIGDAAGMYKAYVWDISSQQKGTNLAWEAGVGDASTIQAFEGSYSIVPRPITNDNAQAQALKLETEGQTLTRYVAFAETADPDDGPQTQPTDIPLAADSPVYVDTLMKFTPSEDDPEVTDRGVKLALFVNANSNLVLRHSYYLGGNYYPTNSIFEGNLINPEQWYRLTIKMQYEGNYEAIQAWVWLDGTPLVHYNGETEQGGAHNGPIFYTINDVTTLSQVSFQGTGYVDDLVVADYHTPFVTHAGTTLTLVFNDNLLNVFDIDNVSISSNATITSGATLKIYTEDWYQINSITGDGIAWTGTTLGGDLVTNATGTVTADAAGRTATINAGLFTGTIPTGLTGPYATVPADKVAAWAVANQLSLANVIANAGDYLDNYLLNISPSVDADIEITSIVYDPVAETATITVEATSTAVDFNSINGTLTVRTGDDLTALGATTEFTFSIDTPGEVVTFVVNEVAGKFIRARVE
ncbi:MAG: hypothetical protein KBI41_09945 [Kiritimatiellae bacterium]|nr:hypothetical protein [Kiritimatiellia bacterium]